MKRKTNMPFWLLVKFFYIQFIGENIRSVSLMTEKQYYMTQEGKEKLEEELHNLKTTKRQEVVERIKIARDFGDLSENSEYDSAKEEQAFVETRIAQLEKMIRNAVIIENDNEDPDVVGLGKSVTFVELPDGDEET